MNAKESPRLKKIRQENAKFEKKSPYNFCDRWCERCTHEKQMRCKLYHDELERKIICIAHGRDEDDPEITEDVLEAQYGDIDEKLSEYMDKIGIDPDFQDIDEEELDEDHLVEFEDLPPEIQDHIKFMEDNPLKETVENYRKSAHDFLKKTFYKEEPHNAELTYHFETVNWYHTLLSAKLNRALAGFHEAPTDGEFAFYDSVAQFDICKKSITESIKALRRIAKNYVTFQQSIQEMLALLYNIYSRIEKLEESIV